MSSMLCVGVVRTDDRFRVATAQRGHPIGEACFPSTALGAAAIRIFLNDCDEPCRLAVKCSELDFAFAWAHGRGQEVLVVAEAVAGNAPGLAAYAARGMRC